MALILDDSFSLARGDEGRREWTEMLFTLQTADQQQQYGPVAIETLRAWVREGRVDLTDFIYDHTLARWFEAPNLPQISDLLTSQPVAPSVPVAPSPSPAGKTRNVKDLIQAHLSRPDPDVTGGPGRPPTVLERISKILVAPYAKGDAPKKQSQKLK